MEDYYFAKQEGGKRSRSKSRSKSKGKAKGKAQGFFGFLAEFRSSPQAKGLAVTEVAKAAGKAWQKMSDAEKAKYGKPAGRKRSSKSGSKSSTRKESKKTSKKRRRSKSKSSGKKSKSRKSQMGKGADSGELKQILMSRIFGSQ